jgi:hypothetical protein
MSNLFLPVLEKFKQFDEITIPRSSCTPRPFSPAFGGDQGEFVKLYDNGHQTPIWKVSVEGESIPPFLPTAH